MTRLPQKLSKMASEGTRRAVFDAKRNWQSLRHPPLKPTCIILGVQKGGTSALYKYLAQHPNVEAPRIKEVNFFSCNSRFERGAEFYHTHFPRDTGGTARRIAFEASPDYMAMAEVAAPRIHAYNPGARLIVLLRNPVTRAQSAWAMYRRNHQANPDWFFNWVKMCDCSISRDAFVPRSPHFGKDFAADLREEIAAEENGQLIEMPVLAHGHYAAQLAHFASQFPASQLKVLISEAFSKDTTAALHEIETFLDIPHHTWRSEDVAPHYVGSYDRVMSDDAKALLDGYYAPHIAALIGDLGQDPGWN